MDEVSLNTFRWVFGLIGVVLFILIQWAIRQNHRERKKLIEEIRKRKRTIYIKDDENG